MELLSSRRVRVAKESRHKHSVGSVGFMHQRLRMTIRSISYPLSKSIDHTPLVSWSASVCENVLTFPSIALAASKLAMFLYVEDWLANPSNATFDPEE